MQVAEVKAKMTNVARDCLAGHPDQSLYMASAGNMRGLNTLPNVESLHESSAKARCMHICSESCFCMLVLLIFCVSSALDFLHACFTKDMHLLSFLHVYIHAHRHTHTFSRAVSDVHAHGKSSMLMWNLCFQSGAVRQLVKDDQRRFYWRKGMAKQARSSLDEDTGLHASLQSYMAKPIEEARLLSGITYLDKRDKRKAFVPSTRDPTQKYQTDIDAKTCGCGMPEIDIGPCKHLLYHADCIGVPFASLLSTKDSLQGYGAQYPADLEFGRPSESEILSEHGHLINDMIRLPLMVRRPALKRAKSAHELLPQKRARPTCSQCHREGHNKKKCSYMPAPL